MKAAHSRQHEAVGSHRCEINDVVGVILFIVVIIRVSIIDSIADSAVDMAFKSLVERVLIPI